MKSTTQVDLAEAIRNLRRELATAMEEGQNEGLHFAVENIELEMSIEIERSGDAEGKVSFKVLGTGLDVGGHGGLTRENSHRLKLTLKAFGPSGSLQIRDEAAGRPR
jgi:hypothetical protein